MEWLLTCGLAFTVLGVSLLVWFGYFHTESRNITLAVAALFSALMFLGLQLALELKTTERFVDFPIELRVDTITRDISVAAVGTRTVSGAGSVDAARLLFESGLSMWLHKSPQVFPVNIDDPTIHKLTMDYAFASLIGYIGAYNMDWQMETRILSTSSAGFLTYFGSLSGVGDRTEVDAGQLRTILISGNNAFATASGFFPAGRIYLPPSSVMFLDSPDDQGVRRRLVIENPFYRFSVVLGVPLFVDQHGAPANASSKGLQIRVIPGRAMIRARLLRSQHRNASKYRIWADRLIGGVDRWFQTASDQTPKVTLTR